MKHCYLVTMYGYDEDEDDRLYYVTGFAKCNQQALTKADIRAIMEDSKKHGDLYLHGVSYLGHMTEDAFEHLRAMSRD
ncbi:MULTISPECIES: hypothetical protein [unclassified Pseudomonas]|uniref:hypothetical protein n=1 Tax=unclassified Pseudomonas TaxID=196821 RepID=UPI000A1ED539|nr:MULTISPECIES: hypothetical protein [unclassified Pseudomonas]